MGAIEELKSLKSFIGSNRFGGNERQAFVMTRAVNDLMQKSPPETLQGADRRRIFDVITDYASQLDTRKPQESIGGMAESVYGIPSTVVSELPRRIKKEGLVKGGKETLEAYAGKRKYLTPPFERMAIDIAALPFYGRPLGFRMGKKIAKVGEPRKYAPFATYGTERGATIPPGAPRTGARRGTYYGREKMAWEQYKVERGARVYRQQSLVPMKHPIFYGTGTSPIEQFERAGGGLLDMLMKRTSVGIEKNIQEAFGKGYSAGEMNVGRKYMGYTSTRIPGVKTPRTIKKKVVDKMPTTLAPLFKNIRGKKKPYYRQVSKPTIQSQALHAKMEYDLGGGDTIKARFMPTSDTEIWRATTANKFNIDRIDRLIDASKRIKRFSPKMVGTVDDFIRDPVLRKEYEPILQMRIWQQTTPLGGGHPKVKKAAYIPSIKNIVLNPTSEVYRNSKEFARSLMHEIAHAMRHHKGGRSLKIGRGFDAYMRSPHEVSARRAGSYATGKGVTHVRRGGMELEMKREIEKGGYKVKKVRKGHAGGILDEPSLNNMFGDRLRKNLNLTVAKERMLFANHPELFKNVKFSNPNEAVKEADRIAKTVKGRR